LRAKREQPYVSMPLTWPEVEKGQRLEFSPREAIARLTKRGDLFAPVLKVKQRLPGATSQPGARRPASRRALQEEGLAFRGVRLPKAKSQSGRRLFLLMKTESGNELWL